MATVAAEAPAATEPLVLKAGVQLALRHIAAKNPKAKTADPAKFYDNSFVKRLAADGFLGSLYK